MKKNQFWALYNVDNFWFAAKTQKECKAEAENVTGEPWAKCKEYFKILKVEINQIP